MSGCVLIAVIANGLASFCTCTYVAPQMKNIGSPTNMNSLIYTKCSTICRKIYFFLLHTSCFCKSNRKGRLSLIYHAMARIPTRHCLIDTLSLRASHAISWSLSKKLSTQKMMHQNNMDTPIFFAHRGLNEMTDFRRRHCQSGCMKKKHRNTFPCV